MRFIHDLEPGKPFNPHRIFRGLFIPDAITSYPRLSPGAKLCYGALCRFGGRQGKAWPSEATLAARLGVKERMVRYYLTELQAERFLAVRQTPGRSNQYSFLWHECFVGRLKLRRDVHVS